MAICRRVRDRLGTNVCPCAWPIADNQRPIKRARISVAPPGANPTSLLLSLARGDSKQTVDHKAITTISATGRRI
jgi:hypothetical protein